MIPAIKINNQEQISLTQNPAIAKHKTKPFVLRQILKIALPIIASIGLALAVIATFASLPSIVFIASAAAMATGVAGGLLYAITRFSQKMFQIRAENLEERKRVQEFEKSKLLQQKQVKVSEEKSLESKLKEYVDEKVLDVMEEYIKEMKESKEEKVSFETETPNRETD